MSKTVTTLTLTGLALAGLTALGLAQSAQAAEEIPTAQSIVAQAEAIAADVETRCELPRREAAEAATADPYALADLDAANQTCREIGEQYGYFVEVITKHADAVTASIPEEARAAAEAAMAAVTPEVQAQMDAGDTEGAVRTLFASIAPSFDIEQEVAR